MAKRVIVEVNKVVRHQSVEFVPVIAGTLDTIYRLVWTTEVQKTTGDTRQWKRALSTENRFSTKPLARIGRIPNWEAAVVTLIHINEPYRPPIAPYQLGSMGLRGECDAAV